MTHNSKDSKVCVIGLDGVPFTLLNEYMNLGYLPGFKRILENNFKLHQMDASIPDVSSTSWASFMTGVNPAEHGIYGFMDLAPGGYQLMFPNYGDVKAPTIWEIAGGTNKNKSSTLFEEYKGKFKKQHRSIVLNIPQTYPAQPLNGILTAGFVAPDLKKGTYPESAYNYLQSMGYVSDVNAVKAKDHKDEFISDIFQALEKRVVAYKHFMNSEKWDIFIGVITETDRLHHFFYDAAFNSSHPYNSKFVDFFKELDKVVADLHDEFMEKTGGNGLFITLSDHGFIDIKSELYLNVWLEKEGLLIRNRKKDYFEQIDSGTKAFAMDPGRIYINMENKYPGGSVKESDREKVADELKERLMGIVDDENRPVIRDVRVKNDLYKGPLFSMGPDLVCLAHDGYDLKGTLQKEEIFGRTHFNGMHTSYDAHCILPGSYEVNGKLHIENIAGFILKHLVNGN